MSWIKRNLSLVISGLLALGLLGYGGWYLYSAIQRNNTIDQETGQTKREIENQLNKNPTPTDENLKIAKQEVTRLTGFIADARRHFPASPPPPQPLDNQTFKSLLETTINDLHKQAASVGIRVGERDVKDVREGNSSYYFTFDNQRLPVTFAPESLRPLTERLHEVEIMADILFKARINRLVSMRRAPVVGERAQAGGPGPGPSNDYIGGVRTNAETGMVLWPYELVFDCFSAELGKVIEALENAKEGFLVKSVSVRQEEKAPPQFRAPTPSTNQPVRLQPRATAASLTNVINERILRVLLQVEVIRPEGPGGGGGGPGPGNPPPGGGRRGGGRQP